MQYAVARSTLLSARRAGNNVLVGLPSSDQILSGGLFLLLKELKEAMAQTDLAVVGGAGDISVTERRVGCLTAQASGLLG